MILSGEIDGASGDGRRLVIETSMEFAHDSTTTAESDVSVTTSESMMLSPGRIQDVEEGVDGLGLEVRKMRRDWRDEIYSTYSQKKVEEEELRKERELLEVKKSQEEKKRNWKCSSTVSIWRSP